MSDISPRAGHLLAAFSTIAVHLVLLLLLVESPVVKLISGSNHTGGPELIVMFNPLIQERVRHHDRSCCGLSNSSRYPESLTNLPIVPLNEITTRSTENSLLAAIAAGQAEIQRRYVLNAKSKVLRSWLSQVATKPPGNFRCNVLIRQNSIGEVIKVELKECGADQRLLQSLFTAVVAASPLPPPPDAPRESEINFSLGPEDF